MEEGLNASTTRSMKRTLWGSVQGRLTFFGSDLTLPRIEPPAAAYLIWIKKMDMQTTRSRQMNVHVAGNGSVRVGTLQPLAEILLGMGVDPTKLLAECGVDPKVFENPENRIPLTLHNRLVALAVVRTRCPHLGLLVGQRDGLQSIGLAGLLARYSEDVESAATQLRALPAHACARRKILARCGRRRRDLDLGDLPAGCRGCRPGG
jgi:hypothetical protein